MLFILRMYIGITTSEFIIPVSESVNWRPFFQKGARLILLALRSLKYTAMYERGENEQLIVKRK